MAKKFFSSWLKFVCFAVFILFTSCNHKTNPSDVETLFSKQSGLESLVTYAQGFDIYERDGIYQVKVYHPENQKVVIKTIYIASKENSGLFDKNELLFISPLDSVALFSATQVNAFDKLGLLDKIIGVSEAKYLTNPYVQQKYRQGQIVELAGSGDFYVETTLMVNPSVIFYSPYKVTESHPLEVTGIPLIPFYDYMETDPLGRAEWIKFTAVFFDRYAQADSLFNTIETAYNNYKKLATEATKKPTVFSDKYFNGQWYVPGGQSYIAKLFEDAGMDYVWKNDQHISSFPLDYEVVYNKAYDADYWRIVGSYGSEASYEALELENGLYRHFKAFRKKQVIWCDAEQSAYFETSPLEPQTILADLIKAVHPELLPDYQPKYYFLLKD